MYDANHSTPRHISLVRLLLAHQAIEMAIRNSSERCVWEPLIKVKLLLEELIPMQLHVSVKITDDEIADAQR